MQKERVGMHLRRALAKISKHLNLMVVPELSHVESSAEAARIGKENGADIVLFAHYESALQGDKPIPFRIDP